MRSRIFSFSLATFVLGLATPVAFALVTPPTWLDADFRLCMAQAIDREMGDRLDAQQAYNDAQIQALQEYRSDLLSAWQIADQRSRNSALNSADANYRNNMNAAKNDFDSRTRNAHTASLNAQRDCRNALSQNQQFVRNICVSNADCYSNQVCSTQRGVCNQSCPPGSDTCVQQCAGTCERVPTTTTTDGNSFGGSTGGFGGSGCLCHTAFGICSNNIQVCIKS